MIRGKKKTIAVENAVIMIAIGQLLDDFPANLWPPVIPSTKEVHEHTGIDHNKVLDRFARIAGREREDDDPLRMLEHLGHHQYALTIHGLRWLYEQGYLRRYVVHSYVASGGAVSKVMLTYPASERNMRPFGKSDVV